MVVLLFTSIQTLCLQNGPWPLSPFWHVSDLGKLVFLSFSFFIDKIRSKHIYLLWLLWWLFLRFEFFFNFKLINLNWRLITLQHCSGFAIHWHESAMGLHLFPILNPLSPPSPSQPSGSSQCTSPEHPASKLNWWSVSHMIIYMFQFCSLKSSHPCLLPQITKDSSLHLCLFCCLAYRVIFTIFLNSIYMRLLYWCFSFWHTSLCIIGSSFIHLIRTDSNVFFLMAE